MAVIVGILAGVVLAVVALRFEAKLRTRQECKARSMAKVASGMCIECTREGRLTAADHEVWVVPDDDADLGIGGGATAVGADFCAEHCPGGCGRRRCARRARRGTMAA